MHRRLRPYACVTLSLNEPWGVCLFNIYGGSLQLSALCNSQWVFQDNRLCAFQFPINMTSYSFHFLSLINLRREKKQKLMRERSFVPIVSKSLCCVRNETLQNLLLWENNPLLLLMLGIWTWAVEQWTISSYPCVYIGNVFAFLVCNFVCCFSSAKCLLS